ncbi:hypothetical protein Aperf_G00000125082 [Anoplocephala perfoliata]
MLSAFQLNPDLSHILNLDLYSTPLCFPTHATRVETRAVDIALVSIFLMRTLADGMSKPVALKLSAYGLWIWSFKFQMPAEKNGLEHPHVPGRSWLRYPDSVTSASSYLVYPVSVDQPPITGVLSQATVFLIGTLEHVARSSLLEEILPTKFQLASACLQMWATKKLDHANQMSFEHEQGS